MFSSSLFAVLRGARAAAAAPAAPLLARPLAMFVRVPTTTDATGQLKQFPSAALDKLSSKIKAEGNEARAKLRAVRRRARARRAPQRRRARAAAAPHHRPCLRMCPAPPPPSQRFVKPCFVRQRNKSNARYNKVKRLRIELVERLVLQPRLFPF